MDFGSNLRKLPGVNGLAGVGLGLAAATLTGAAGFAAERLGQARRTAVILDDDVDAGDLGTFEETPDELPVVLATDGLPLHVEVDHPAADAPPLEDGQERPTIVFSHGYCLSLRCWVFQRRALRAAGYRIVLWDQRGHGRSGPGDAQHNDIDQLGHDLARVIEVAAPTGPLILVGHSMGGMTMMSLALHHEQLLRRRVIGAAFIATSPGRLGETTLGMVGPVGKTIFRLAPFATTSLANRQELVNGSVKLGREFVDLVVDWGSFGSPVPLSIAQLTTDMIFGTRMDVISSFLPRFSRHDKHEALARYQGIETLVLNGTEDRLTPPAHSEEIVRRIPGAEHVVIADAGHIIMLEHPTVVAEQIIALVHRAERVQAFPDEVTERVPAGMRHVVTDLESRRRAREAWEHARIDVRSALRLPHLPGHPAPGAGHDGDYREQDEHDTQDEARRRSSAT